jgi:outer membrane protein W
MKKITFLVGALALSTAVLAQRPIDSNPFSLEGGLSLNSLTNSFTAPMIKFRYFATDNFAARIGFQHNYSQDVYNVYGLGADFYPNVDSLGTQTLRSATTWISLGGSYHFSQMERLSPYIALDVLVGFGSQHEDWKDFSPNSGAPGDGDFTKGSNAEVVTKNNGFGLGLAAGFDYYFAENVFIGAELGLSLRSTVDKGGEMNLSGTTIKIHAQGNSITFGNSATAAIRMGWRF